MYIYISVLFGLQFAHRVAVGLYLVWKVKGTMSFKWYLKRKKIELARKTKYMWKRKTLTFASLVGKKRYKKRWDLEIHISPWIQCVHVIRVRTCLYFSDWTVHCMSARIRMVIIRSYFCLFPAYHRLYSWWSLKKNKTKHKTPQKTKTKQHKKKTITSYTTSS